MTRVYTPGLAGLALLAAGCDFAEPVLPPVEAAGPAIAADEAKAPDPAPTSAERPDTELTCTWPVTAGDSVTSLRARYGTAVQVAELAGPEGTTLPGVILWPEDSERRIEVVFTSERLDQVYLVRANAPSQWSLLGLRNHDSINVARGINGRPFQFYGFGWDAGGEVADFRGGHFGRLGNCRATMVLAFDYDLARPPLALVGDIPLMSDHPDIDEQLVFIDQIGVAFDTGY